MSRITLTAASRVGCVRTNNEDMVLAYDKMVRSDAYQTEFLTENTERFVIALADGMGGHQAGEVASEQTLESLKFFISDIPRGMSIGEFEETMVEWLKFINNNINRQGHVDPALLEIVDNYAEDKYNDVLACSKIEDVNLALFKLIGVLNPSLPAYWKGQQVGDITQFCADMAVAYDKDLFMDALKSGIVSQVAQEQGMASDTISKIKEIESEAANGADEELTAYKLNYYITGDYVYDIGGTECRSIKDLVLYIRSNTNQLEAVCEEFINDIRFFAWLEVLGYAPQIEKWRQSL